MKGRTAGGAAAQHEHVPPRRHANMRLGKQLALHAPAARPLGRRRSAPLGRGALQLSAPRVQLRLGLEAVVKHKVTHVAVLAERLQCDGVEQGGEVQVGVPERGRRVDLRRGGVVWQRADVKGDDSKM